MIKHALCEIETVCSLSGHTRERTYELVDEGEYMWSWNISSATDHTELRFWSAEINRKYLQQNIPGMLSSQNWLKRLTIDQVIGQLIPKRTSLPGQYNGLRQWEVVILLRIQRRHLDLFKDELPQRRVKGDPRVYVSRPDLERFLRDRWTGNIARKNVSHR